MKKKDSSLLVVCMLVAIVTVAFWAVKETRGTAGTTQRGTAAESESLSRFIRASEALAARGAEVKQESASATSRRAFVQSFVTLAQSARVIELNFIWDEKSPVMSLNPPFAIGLHSSHKETAGIFPGGIAWAEDMMFFSGQHGAPTIDAVGHISDHLKLYGGLDATANEGPHGLLKLGIETYPQERFINRGVLLDVARFKGVDALAPGQEITAKDLEATARSESVEIRAGDSVLIRTGFGKYFNTDTAKYKGYRPGPGERGARWLAGKKIFLTGDDQMSYEVVPAKGTIFPVHRILIADYGIYLVENLNLEELSKVSAEEGVYEFVLVLNPPRLRGATGAPLNAFAIMPQ